MKKIYLTSCLSIVAGMGFAQYKATDVSKMELKQSSEVSTTQITIVDGTVERGSAFWSEDFSNGLAGAGSNGAWTTDGTDGGLWKQDFFGSSGCWSVSTPTPATTSASNGFMLFDADSANCADPSTSTMTNPIVDFVGGLISPDIDLSAQSSVMLNFEQSFRFCCASTINLYVYVYNGSTWSAPINVSYALATNAQSPNPQTVSLNITSLAGGASNAKIKFEWNTEGHYYWAIDDISLTPAAPYDVRLNTATFWNETRDLLADAPIDYPTVPTNQLDNIVLRGEIENQGANTAINTNLVFSVENVATTVVGSGNSPLNDLNSASARADSATWNATSAPVDTYTLYLTADHDDILSEANTTDNDRSAGTIKVTPTSGTGIQWARDNGTNNGSYTNGNGSAYITGNSFYVYNDITVYSIDAAFMGGTNITDPGTVASVTLFEMDPAAASIADVFVPIFSGSASGIDYTITTPMLSSSTTTVWNKFPVNPAAPTTGILLTAGKQYMAAVEGYGGPDELSLGISGFTPNQDRSAWFYGDGGQGVDWYYTTRKLKIRLGLDPGASFLGVDEQLATNLSLSQNVPNPANNTTVINYSLNESADVTFEVVDLTGKVIYTETMGNKGAGLYSMNLNTTDFAAGVYYYTMTAGADKITKKMMITK